MLAYYLALLDDEDRQLFLWLYKTYVPRLRRVALSILGKNEDAEDALQDAMLSIARHFDTAKKIILKSRTEIAPWCVVIVKHAAISVLRKRNRAAALPEGWEPPGADGVESAAAAAALVELIRAMPEQYRTVLELRLISEWSFSEIGQAVGLNADAARIRYHRGLAQLRERLREVGYAYGGDRV